MKDRTISVLFLATCFSLWLNLLFPRITASAEETRGYTLQSVYLKLVAIQSDLAELKREVGEINNGLTAIQTGSCRNPKVC